METTSKAIEQVNSVAFVYNKTDDSLLINIDGETAYDVTGKAAVRLMTQAQQLIPFCVLQRKLKRIIRLAFDMDIEKVIIASRKMELVEVRKIAMYWGKYYTRFSEATIGKSLGGKDPSTVHFHAKEVKDRITVDKVFKQKVEKFFRAALLAQ